MQNPAEYSIFQNLRIQAETGGGPINGMVRCGTDGFPALCNNILCKTRPPPSPDSSAAFPAAHHHSSSVTCFDCLILSGKPLIHVCTRINRQLHANTVLYSFRVLRSPLSSLFIFEKRLCLINHDLENTLQPALLEALLAHMDKAAETNGAAANGTDEKAAEGVSIMFFSHP